MATFEHLDWDSDFLGFGVVRVEPGVAGDALADALGQARDTGARLAYWMPTACAAALRDAQALGGTVAGTQVRLEREVGTVGAGPPGVRRLPIPSVEDAALVALAVSAGAGSRFAVDPRMPAGTMPRLYETWIRRSVRGEIAESTLVASRDGGDVAGLATLGVTGTLGTIGLVAVDAAARRQGLGYALMEGVRARAAELCLGRLRVTTQEGNTPALRLYESCGFRPVLRSLAVHFWL